MDACKCGSFIAERRKELQMTQKELAQKIDVTDKAVSRWERGLGYPDIQLLEPLSYALGISISELLNAERMNRIDMDEVSIRNVVNLAYNEKESIKKKYLYYFVLPIFLVGMLCALAYLLSAQFSGLWIISGILSFIFLLFNFILILRNRIQYSSILCLISISLISFVVLEEYRLAAFWLNQKDMSALLDVVPTVSKGLSFLLCLNIFLNFLMYMISEIKKK